jgi:hypothetical protein
MQVLIADTTPTTTSTPTTSTTSTTSTSTTVPPPEVPAPTTAAPTTAAPTTAAPTTSAAAALSAIGDLVWLDADGDGLQQPDEAGLEGVVVVLLDGTGRELARDVTDHLGRYEFAQLPAGPYALDVELPDGYGITLPDQGVDDEVDSDLRSVDELRATARTELFALPLDRPGSVDLGLVVLEDEGGGDPATTSSEVVSTDAPPATAAPTTAAPTTTEPAPTEPPTTTAAPTTVATTTAPTTTLPPTTTAAPGG